MTEGEAQAALAQIALELVAITDRLQRIHHDLPVSPGREAMWAHELPFDVATEIYGVIEAVLVDEIRPAIKYLEAASRVTVEELREQHRERQALLRKLSGRLRDEIGQ